MSGTKGIGCAARGARPHGFTMTEVVVVVAIIGILAAIAYPSYSTYKVRANRAAAKSLLMELASRQQQYFIDARGYATDLSALGLGTPHPDVALVYTLDAPTVDNTATPPTFAVTASPKSGTIQSSDGQLRVTSTGTKTRGGAPW